MKSCFKCGKEWSGEKRQPGPKDFCEACSAYLHCCKNCRFHDPKVHNQCRIPNTEWVGDRTGLNYCDEFEFADRAQDAGGLGRQERALDALGNLFGETLDAQDTSRDGAKNAFDKLFGD